MNLYIHLLKEKVDIMKKTEKTKCPKCRKKVDAEIKAEGELICPICSKSLGFVFATEKNLFIEMVQLYLTHKRIRATATINEDGHLDIQIDMDKEDQQQLADLLSKCIPISYVITNTAIVKKKPRNLKSVSRNRTRKKKNTSDNLERFF